MMKYRKRRLSVLLGAILAALLLAAPASAQANTDQLTDEEVSEAIQKIKDHLYETQHESGAWFGKYHGGPNDGQEKNFWGPTAMALLALISSGESPQHPDIAKGLELLAKVEFHGVYALSMRAHVWSYLPQGVYGELLEKDAETMYNSWYGWARFNYPVAEPGESFNDKFGGSTSSPKNGGRVDNSTTQYGVLALWQASKRDIDIPNRFWELAVANFLELQSDHDGGWAYNQNKNTSQSMTLAGLTVMYVAQQELFRDKSVPNPKIQASINKGLSFLDKNFSVQAGVHGGVSYMWYGYERVGLASGRKYFGGKDWFQEIAHEIVKRNARYGVSIQTAALDLMFLARGRVPVWINKLEVPGTAWNNRPNDVYYLNRYISGYREHEVNWQVVNVDTSEPADWIAAPLMWISSPEAMQLTDAQVAKLKTYIDLGGTLIVNPEEKSASFRRSMEELAAQMYPDLEFTSLDRKHPMANLLEGDPRGSRAPDMRVLSNGARILMIMPDDDWGMTFQQDRNPDPDKNQHWKNITNIYGVVTDRGSLTPRLSSPLVDPVDRDTAGTIKVVIPQWQDPAGKMPETDVYRVMKTYMHNRTGMKLQIDQVPLTELSAADPALLHLVGIDAIEIKPEEREAIQAYVQGGGTVLIENLGGRGDFAKSVTEQLQGILPGRDETVSTRSDIITGRNLPEGSTKNRRLVYRRLVLENANPDADLMLRGYMENDRYPVLLSYEDLSLGMLGVKQYGINGYGPSTARDLMVNILLEANKNKAGE